jgi:hypothetical protein
MILSLFLGLIKLASDQGEALTINYKHLLPLKKWISGEEKDWCSITELKLLLQHCQFRVHLGGVVDGE